MAIELEGLEFEITSSSTKAEKGLKGLHDTLVRIRNAVKGGIGLGTVANQVKKLADNVNRVDTDKLERLARACEALRGIRGPSNLARGFERMADATARIDVERVERLRDALQGMNGIRLPRFPITTGGNGVAPAGDTPATPVDSDVENVGEQVEETTERVNRLHNALQGLGGVFARTFQTGAGTLRTFGRIVRSVWNGVRGLGRAAAVLPKQLGAGLAAKIKHTTSSLGQFFASIKRIAMYRLIRSALKAITQGFSEGIKNLYHWSDALGGTFAKSMDKLATDAQYLKNSLAAMAAPLINALAPAIDFITDKIVDFLNYVNQLIAKLTGASTYTVAKKVAAEWDDASKKTKKATDEIKRYTLGFDELNILGKKDKDKDSSSKIETDYSKMFETKQVDSSISDVTKKLQDMFRVLKQAWEQYGEATVNAAKTAFNTLKHIISDVGDTLHRVFTQRFGFDWATSTLKLLQSILEVLNAIGNAFRIAWNDNNRGFNYIASLFSAMTRVKELLASIGNSFREAWDSGIGVQIWSNILEIATGLNNIIGNLAESINRAWNTAGLGTSIWLGLLTIVNTVLTAINRMVQATANWAANLDFVPILSGFDKLLWAINPVVEKITNGLAWAYEHVLLPVGKWTIEAGLPAVLGLLSAAFGLLNSVLEGLKEPALYIWDNFLQPIGKWTGGVITTVLEKLTDVLTKLSNWIDTHKEAFDAIVETIGAFVAGWMGAKAIIGIISGIAHAGSMLVGGLGILAGSFDPVFLAIEAVIAIGVLLYQHWDEIKEAAEKLGAKISEVWENIKQWTSEKWKSIKTTVTTTWNNLKVSAAEKFTTIKTKIVDTWDNLKSEAKTVWETIKSNVTEKWEGLKTSATEKFTAIRTKITTEWNTIKTNTLDKWNTIKTNVTEKWENIRKSAADKFTEVKDKITTTWSDLQTNTSETWESIKTKATGLWGEMQTNVSTTFTDIGTSISNTWSAAQEVVGGFIDWVGTTFSGNWETAWNGIIDLFGSIFGKVSDLMKEPINAVIRLLNSMISKIESAINSVVDGVNTHLSFDLRWEKPAWLGGGYLGWQWSPNLQHVYWNKINELATGGILELPTMITPNTVAGEAGREAVLPLETHTEWMDTLAEKVREGLPGADGDLTNSVREGMTQATAREVELMRQLLIEMRKFNEKDFTAEVTFDDFTKAAQRKNRIYGQTVIPIG